MLLSHPLQRETKGQYTVYSLCWRTVSCVQWNPNKKDSYKPNNLCFIRGCSLFVCWHHLQGPPGQAKNRWGGRAVHCDKPSSFTPEVKTGVSFCIHAQNVFTIVCVTKTISQSCARIYLEHLACRAQGGELWRMYCAYTHSSWNPHRGSNVAHTQKPTHSFIHCSSVWAGCQPHP